VRGLPGRYRRASILAAARRALAKRGFLATRAQDVARAAGISEGLLYRYFPSLEDLQKAVLTRCLKESAARRSADPAGARSLEGLRSIATDFLNTVDRDPDFLRLALFGALTGVADSAALLRRENLKAERRVAALLRSWKGRALIRKDVDASGLARVIAAVLMYEAIIRALTGSKFSSRRLETLLTGVGPLLENGSAGGRDLPVGKPAASRSPAAPPIRASREGAAGTWPGGKLA
jgi:AcrR family transcriptional regulator